MRAHNATNANATTAVPLHHRRHQAHDIYAQLLHSKHDLRSTSTPPTSPPQHGLRTTSHDLRTAYITEG